MNYEVYINQFLGESKKGSANTSGAQAGDLKKFFQLVFGKELSDVEKEDVESITYDTLFDYFNEEFEEVKNTTKNRHMSTIKEFLRFLKKRKDTTGLDVLESDISFLGSVKAFNDDSEGTTYIPLNVVEEFLAEAKKELHHPEKKNRIIYLAADQGLRRQELLNLTWSNFAEMDDGVLIRGYGKRNAEYTKKISYEVYDYVLEIKPEGATNKDLVFEGLNAKAISQMMKRIEKNLGYEGKGYTFHSFRDFAITFGYRLTGDILEAQRIAGHSNLDTTRKYLQALDYGVMGVFSLGNIDKEAYKNLTHEELLATIELMGRDFAHILNIRSQQIVKEGK